MKYFEYDKVNGGLSLAEPDILLITEFAELIRPTRNRSTKDKLGKKLELAFKEFKYLFLFFDWESPYFQFAEKDRHSEALKDSGLTKEEFDDPKFRAACKKYDEIQNSSLEIRLLRSAMNSVENVINYLQNIDLTERDPVSGKPIFKTKELIQEIKGCKDIITSLRELESQVKKGMEAESNIRGGAEVGLFD